MTTTPKLWKAPTQVNTLGSAFGGQIAGLEDGGYVVVWVRKFDIYGQLYESEGNKVGGEVLLSPANGSGNYAPAVTVLSNGNIAVAFSHVDVSAPDDDDVQVRIFDPALNLLRTDFVDTSNAKQTFTPSITALADGGYVVSYTAGVGAITPTSIPDDTDIVARIVSPTGVVGAQFDIDNQDDNRTLSQLATLSNGNFVAVYQDEFHGNAADTDIRYGIFTPTGAHVGTTGLSVSGGNGNFEEHHPDVAALRNGGFVVVWTDPDSPNGFNVHIQAAILSNTGAIVRDNITLDSTGTDHEGSVVALADGGFLVSWEAIVSSGSVTLAQRFDADGDKIGAQFTVKDGDKTGDTPQAALLSDGHIAFAVGDPVGDPVTGTYNVMTSIFTVDTPNDFDANGESDILWQKNDGTPAIWLMNGLSPVWSSALPNPGPAWHAVDTGDFNGDDHADLLWQKDDGTPAVWLIDGVTPIGAATLPNPSAACHAIAAGDFSGDGRADILWQNNDGTPEVWLMDDPSAIATSALPNPGSTWHVVDAGDFNGDGRADILWQNDDGTPAVWLMDGLSPGNAAALPNPGPTWHAIATGDFNGDNRADILWQNDDGTPAVWLMDGLSTGNAAALPNPGPAWHAIDTGDFNGDGRADILWQNDDGTPAVWLMDGLAPIGGAGLPNPGTDWHVIA